jgi:hypothetical protein
MPHRNSEKSPVIPNMQNSLSHQTLRIQKDKLFSKYVVAQNQNYSHFFF